MKRTLSSILAFALILGAMLITASTAPAWRGDANGDGQINLSDVVTILRHIAAWDIEIDPLADFDEDGGINLRDVSLVLKYIAQWNVAPDSLLEAEYGVSAVDFDVPEPTPTETVKGSEFGFSTEAVDNYDAWTAAIAYLKEHPGTTLEIEKGVYKMSKNKNIAVSGLQNCVIDGGGSTFLFSKRNFFSISGVDLLTIKNFTVDWDYETTGYPTTSVVRVRNRYDTDDPSLDKLEYEFILVDDASYAVTQPWDSMLHMDPETLTVGVIGGKGDMFNVSEWHKGFELTEPNVVTATIKSSAGPAVGETWMVRHYNYGAGCLIQSSGTNVTYKDINIYSGPSGGIYLQNQGSHHVRIDGVTVGLNPDKADHIRMSVTADALNFKNTGGYIIVENCDIGYQGDDCINIHSTPGIVEYAYDNQLEIIVRNGNNFYVGCEVGFDKAYDHTDHDFTAVVTGYQHIMSEDYGQHYLVTLDRDVPDDIADAESEWIVHNKSNNGEYYIIRNNYFHENRARALLLGSPNGLVENNRFYKTQLAAINISLDHGSQWIEGTGADNIIIRNNVFEECNLIGNDAYINIFASSEFGMGGMILGECFKDILISGNTFINPKSEILSARSIVNLAFVNNLIKNPDELKNISDPNKTYPNRGKIVLRGYQIKDATVIHNIWETSPYIAENVNEIDVAAKDVKENELTQFGNNIVEVKE